MTQRSKKKNFRLPHCSRFISICYYIHIFAERRGRRSSFFFGNHQFNKSGKVFFLFRLLLFCFFIASFLGDGREKRCDDNLDTLLGFRILPARVSGARHTEKRKERNASSSFRVHRDRQIVCLFRRFFLSFYTKSFQEMATTTNLGPGGNSLISESHARNNFKSRNGKTKQARLRNHVSI